MKSITTTSGSVFEQALAVNQRQFTPTKADDEQEVNGCSVFICENKSLDLIDARSVLKKVLEQLLKP